jgi:hypothetical protein
MHRNFGWAASRGPVENSREWEGDRRYQGLDGRMLTNSAAPDDIRWGHGTQFSTASLAPPPSLGNSDDLSHS